MLPSKRIVFQMCQLCKHKQCSLVSEGPKFRASFFEPAQHTDPLPCNKMLLDCAAIIVVVHRGCSLRNETVFRHAHLAVAAVFRSICLQKDRPCKVSCSRPSGWCAHSGAIYKLKDCDGDGILDHFCSDSKGKSGAIESAADCRQTWPKGKCTGKPAVKAKHWGHCVSLVRLI